MSIDQFDPLVVQAAAERSYEKIGETADELHQYLRRVSLAYKRVFNRDDPDVAFVLADLAKFGRAHQTRFDKDERVQTLLEGRAEAYYRIVDYARLDNDTLYLKHKTAMLKQEI